MKNISTIFGLVILLGIGFYFFSFSPKQKQAAFENEKKCYEATREKYGMDFERSIALGADAHLFYSHYFDHRAVRCLYLEEKLSKDGNSDGTIIDIYSGEVISSYVEDEKGQLITGDKKKFNKLKSSFLK